MPEPAKTSCSVGSGTSAVVGSAGGGEGTDSVSALANGQKENEIAAEVNPFAEYMWMENEEEYNKQVEEELLEQEFLDRCFQEMSNEEDHDWFIPSRDLALGAPGWQLHGQGQRADTSHLQQHFQGLSLADSQPEDIAEKSILNPEAKEFVPGVRY